MSLESDFYNILSGGYTETDEGTAQAGSANSLTLAADADDEDEAYVGQVLSLTAGEGAPETRTITAYNGTTKVAAVSPAWTGTIVAPSFDAPLSDLGDGEVDLTLSRGVGSATFTRASVATCRLADGTLKKVASGVPRSHYLADGTYAGYFSEGGRTNLALRSEEFDSVSWGKTDTTITANAGVAPDGTTTADLCTEGGGGTADVRQSFVGTADANYAISFFFKRGNHDWVRVRVAGTSNGAFNGWFNLATGVVGSTSLTGSGAALISASIEAWDDGWYRCVLVGSVGNGDTTILVQTLSATADAGGRVSGGERYQWGAQFENSVSFASSYIPTESAAAGRLADSLTYPVSGNMSVGTAGGSVYLEQTIFGLASTALRRNAFAGNSATSLERLELRGVSDLSITPGFAYGTGVSVPSLTGNSLSEATAVKLGIYYGDEGGALFQAGAKVASSALASDLGSGHTSMFIASGSSGLFGAVKNVRIWQEQLSDADLQTLTGEDDITLWLPDDTTEYLVPNRLAGRLVTLAGENIIPSHEASGVSARRYVVYSLVFGEPRYDLDGVTGLTKALMQVDCYAESAIEAVELAAAVVAAVPVTGWPVHRTGHREQDLGLETGTRLFRRMLEFSIFHRG